ncbi:LytR/AlgR family response regulator transcription factor [Aquimarina sp. 2201CG5-10]|uniref:LytR/AlgR family response regulator transcription factor n=1 Tax=Aquimarina callyspongiae TaxID=3098150 RepID=UPI002AB4B882|nr:LytTR family transcriptional regulator DNA-binding domain-containing protein [Aquimarina sp. 2201CG5-10]MDY8135925.1 LytTR family transcriptional regulator DNA-binding domain-containing protein [Aquimarina sp. 2201CG5-10]
MKIYNCLIVDDETLAQELIENHLKKIPNVDIIAKCHTAMEALSVLNEQAVDIMFLDIQMPDLTGLELLKSLDKPPYTILTTAYSEYALESYELNVVDYLLKPIRFDRFFKAIGKALTLLNDKTPANVQNEETEDYIFVKSDYKAVKIRFNDIEYIESMQKYVKFYTKDKMVMSLMSLTSLNDILPSSKFFRSQKSYIVNLSKIESIDGNLLIMSSGAKIPVSKRLKGDLIHLIDPNQLL